MSCNFSPIEESVYELLNVKNNNDTTENDSDEDLVSTEESFMKDKKMMVAFSYNDESKQLNLYKSSKFYYLVKSSNSKAMSYLTKNDFEKLLIKTTKNYNVAIQNM